MSGRRARRCLVALAGIALVGCASTPTRAPPVEPVHEKAPTEAVLTFEAEQREKAVGATRRNALEEAALAWEVLVVLRPDVTEYRERLRDTRKRIEEDVSERLAGAALAARQGDLDGATRKYLEVLALQPDNEPADDALRALERERNRRNTRNKSAHPTIARAAQAAQANGEKPVVSNEMATRNDLEHASMLADNGEFDEAIGLLQTRLAGNSRDAVIRRLLAEVYFRKAESLLPLDRAAALAALKRSVQLDPTEPAAAARLEQLQGGAATPPAATRPRGGKAAESPP